MRLLFVAPCCLIDPSSGASTSCRMILEGLAARGHVVAALGSTVFDHPADASAQEFLKRMGAQRGGAGKSPVWAFKHNGVAHLLTHVRSQRRLSMTAIEEDVLFGVLRKGINQIKPDVVMTIGGQVLNYYLRYWLAERGFAPVVYLANPSYKRIEAFDNVSRIVTDTQATARLYRERLGINPEPIGKFITPVDVSTPGDSVTFINPSTEKGVGLFVAIAKQALARGLKTRFLVIESRGRLGEFLQTHQMTPADLPNVEIWPMQSDMTACWQRTAMLLLPSRWHDSGPRVVVEALSAGIPVLGTETGGTPEMLNGSGYTFPQPPGGVESWKQIAGPEDAAPWVDRIAALEADPAAMNAARAKAREAWKSHRGINRYDLIEAILQDVANQRAGKMAEARTAGA